LNNFNKTILPNGIRIVSEHIPHVKSFTLGFWFDAGTRDEQKKLNGISHFIEHMLFKGTTNRSAKKIAEDIEGYGGYLNAFTSKEHTCYYGRGLSEHFERTFDVISDMIQNPVFKPIEIKREAKVVIEELNDIDDNPEEFIFDKFEEIIFTGNTLTMPIIGTEKNLLNYTQNDLFNFVKSRYGHNNLIISASGNIKHEDIIRYVEKYFKKDLGKIIIKRKPTILTDAPDYTISKSVQQVHMIIGRATYGYNDKKRISVNILSHLLGEGNSSRLFQTLREKNGIAYQLNTFLNSFYDVSTFGVYLSTNVKQVEKAQSLIYSEFKKLIHKAVGSAELRRAKEFIKGNMIMGFESTTSRMFRMASTELYFKRLITIDEMIKLIDAVTPEEILELSKEVLNESTLTKVIISPDKLILKSAA